MDQMTPTELKAQLENDDAPCVLDVREPWELEVARLENTIDIPMNQLPEKVNELRDQLGTRTLIVMCHSGVRSAMAIQFLHQQGFERVANLEGGIQGWSEQVDQTVPTY